MTNERLEELLLINSKVDGEDYSILREFLETSPFVRISYLLKLKYYHSSINEKEYRNFNNNNNVDDKEVLNFEIKLTRYKTIEILTKILNNNYSIERKDITNFLEYIDLKKMNYNEIYKALLALKNMARSINGFVFITLNKDLLENKIYNLIQYISDYIFRIRPFSFHHCFYFIKLFLSPYFYILCYPAFLSKGAGICIMTSFTSFIFP